MGRDDHKGKHISLRRGRGKLGHNRRRFLSPNVDPTRVKDNIVIKQQELTDAYEELFGAPQQVYDAKQKRKNLKIGDYYQKLFGEPKDEIVKGGNAGRQQNFYEYVIGIGDKDDTGFATNPEDAAIAIECLKEYFYGNEEHGLESFQERNPNFHLMDAIIHCDESTPHAHYDIIPWSDGYKTGMTRQQGINRALEKMGYGSNGSKAIAAWTRAERQVFREICERHGIEVAKEEKGRGFDYTVEEYKEHKELENENKVLAAVQEALKTDNDFYNNVNDQLREVNATLNKTAIDLDKQIKTKQATLKDLDEQTLNAVEIPPRPQLPPPLPPDEPRPMREHRGYTRAEEKELAREQKLWDKSHAKGGERWNAEQQHKAQTEQALQKCAEWDAQHQPIAAAKNAMAKAAAKLDEAEAAKRQALQMQQQVQAELERGRAEVEKGKRANDKRSHEIDIEVGRRVQEELARTDKYQRFMATSVEWDKRMEMLYKGADKRNQKAFEEKVKAMQKKEVER